jgi:hypothetical protein
MPHTVDSPSLVPFPAGLVVKNSNTCSRVPASIPQPVSLTASSTTAPP